MTGIMVLVGIISGLVFAAVTVLLFIFGQLALIGFGVVTALIIAGLLLLVVAGAALFSENRPKLRCCIKQNLGGLFFGFIGTLLSGILAISATPIIFPIFTLIIVGFVAFFVTFTLVSILFLVKCVVD